MPVGQTLQRSREQRPRLLGTKAVAAVFLLFGALPLWAAVGVDVGASLLVVANGLRLVAGRPVGKHGLPILERSPVAGRTVSV
ncbi:MAG: hypothetical protein AB7G37_11235 [Solirubrobacteraceae bacterium]